MFFIIWKQILDVIHAEAEAARQAADAAAMPPARDMVMEVDAEESCSQIQVC